VIGGQPEIVVAAERDGGATIDDGARGLGTIEQAAMTPEAARVERGNFAAKSGSGMET
jgi:hypothetical protein